MLEVVGLKLCKLTGRRKSLVAEREEELEIVQKLIATLEAGYRVDSI